MFNESGHFTCNSPRRFLEDEVDFSQWMIDEPSSESKDLFQEEKIGLNDSKNPKLNELVNSFFSDSLEDSKKNDNKISLAQNLHSHLASNLCYPQLTTHFFNVHGVLQLSQFNPKIYKSLKHTLKITVDIGVGFNRLPLDECDFDLHLLKFTLTEKKRILRETEGAIYSTMKTQALSYEKVEFAYEGIDLSHIACPLSNKPLYRFRFSICPWGTSDMYMAETDEFRVFSKKIKRLDSTCKVIKTH